MLTVGKLPDGVNESSLTWVPVRLYEVADGGLKAPSFAPNEVRSLICDYGSWILTVEKYRSILCRSITCFLISYSILKRRWEIDIDGVFLDGKRMADSAIPATGTANNTRVSALLDTVRPFAYLFRLCTNPC